MDTFFDGLEGNLLARVLTHAEQEQDLYLLLNAQGLVVRQNQRATLLLDDMRMQSFSEIVSDPTATLLRNALRANASAQTHERIDGRDYQLDLLPTEDKMLVCLRTCTPSTSPHALGVRVEAQVNGRLQRLQHLLAQIEGNPALTQQLRTITMQINREMTHAAILREGAAIFGMPDCHQLRALSDQVATHAAACSAIPITVHGGDATVYANSTCMQIVLYNIVLNALQARGVTKVEIHIYDLGEDVCWEVRNDGTPYCEQPRTGAMAQVTTGMGLAVCKKLLAAQGAALSINPVASGTCCRMFLPIAPAGELLSLAQPQIDLGCNLEEMMFSPL